MAKELTIDITGLITASYKKTGNSTLQNLIATISQSGFQENLINGTGDGNNIVNLLYSARHNIVDTAGVTLDLTSVTDPFGDTISLSTRKLLFIKNLAASGTNYQLICASLFATGIDLKPQEWRLFGCAESGGADFPSTLAFTTASTTAFDFDILVAGIAD